MTSRVRCKNCGHVWNSGITITDVAIVGFEGTGTAPIGTPCPECGTMNSISPVKDGVYSTGPDGWVRTVREIAQMLARADTSTLRVLRTDLESAREAGDSERAVAAITSAGLLTFLRDQDNRMEIWTAIAAVFAIVTFLLALRGEAEPRPLTPDEEDRVCRQVITKVVERETFSNGHLVEREHVKIKRNERCPCGSGAKFKKCHGRHPTDPLSPDRGRTEDQ